MQITKGGLVQTVPAGLIEVSDSGGYFGGGPLTLEEILNLIGAGLSPMSHVAMPLTTVVGGLPELVWDADNSLIPTLIPMP